MAEAAEVALTLYEETGGNPLYVTQLLAHLVEAGILQRFDGRWTRPTPVDRLRLPESLREVVLGRVTACATTGAASPGAGGGRRRALRRPRPRADRRHRRALARRFGPGVPARLVEQVGRPPSTGSSMRSFATWCTIELSTVRRARLHDRLAEQLEEPRVWRGAYLAHHSAESALLGPAQQARAVRYARRAGDEAYGGVRVQTAAALVRRGARHLAETGAAGSDSEGRARRGPASTRSRPTQRRHRGVPGYAARSDTDRPRRGLVDLRPGHPRQHSRHLRQRPALDDDRIELLRAALAVIPGPTTCDQAAAAVQLRDGAVHRSRLRRAAGA